MNISRLALFITAAVAFPSQQAQAQDVFQSSGPSMTKGSVATSSDVSSSMNNPAAPSYFLKGQSGFDYNLIGPIAGGYELGQIDSLVDELDELIDILEDDDLSAQDALDAKDRFDPFLRDAAQNGMIKVGGNAAMPLFPIFYHSNDLGTFTGFVNFSGSIRSTVLDDEIDIITINDTITINTSAALYIKSAGLTRLGIGYSRPLWTQDGGLLHAGVTVNVNQYKLAKNIVSLSALEDGEDIGDAIQDDYENNANTATSVSIDAGLLWVSDNYNLGISVNDINEPEYDYGSLTSDCSNLSGISVDNCFVAQDVIAQGRIAGDEVFVANAQAKVHGSIWMGENTRLGLHASYDVNDKNDAIGDIYQWSTLSASLELDSWWLPEIRAGYSQNLKGTELSYYSLGLTFFGKADLDIRYSDESVDIDGTSAPRSAYLSFAIQSSF